MRLFLDRFIIWEYFHHYSVKKKNPIFENNIGAFELVYSKHNKNFWSINDHNFEKTIRGTKNEPFLEHINFLKTVDSEIEMLSRNITNKFIKEFKEAKLDVDFDVWSKRFLLVSLDVMLITDEEICWNITFEDKKSPFYHFTVFIENGQIENDFSIDS